MTASLLNHDYRLRTDVHIKDYQGNIRAVYDQSRDCIVQQTDYYPYGLPKAKATSIGAEVNPFKYGGKELNTHLPQPFYDFVARMQLPQLCLFQRPDPKASDYTWLNPFTYCAGDPINFFDPDGMKRYFVDMIGRIVSPEVALNHSEYDMYKDDIEDDQIVIVDKDGKVVSASDTYPKGTITLHNNSKSDLKDVDVTMFEIIGDNASQAVFELLSRTITARNNIEYGHITRGNNKSNNKNVVFTGHKKNMLYGFNEVFNQQLHNKRIFRDIIHSHKRSPDPSKPDFENRKQVNDALTKRKRRLPQYFIYVSDVPIYVNYTNFLEE